LSRSNWTVITNWKAAAERMFGTPAEAVARLSFLIPKVAGIPAAFSFASTGEPAVHHERCAAQGWQPG